MSRKAELALGHLVGTSFMRAYKHSVFVDNRLCRKAKAWLAFSRRVITCSNARKSQCGSSLE